MGIPLLRRAEFRFHPILDLEEGAPMRKKANLKFFAFVLIFVISFLVGIYLGLNHKNRARDAQNASYSVSETRSAS